MADQTATEQLIQQLRKPKQDKTDKVLAALTAFASPEAQKQIAPLLNTGAMSDEEKRLSAASNLELALNKGKAQKAMAQRKKDESSVSKLGLISSGIGRGSKIVRDQRVSLERADAARGKIQAMIEGRIVPTAQNMKDVSTDISALISGGTPPLALIEGTAYSTWAGRLNNLKQEMTGNPEAFNNPEILNEILNGVNVIMGTKRKWHDNLQRNLYNNSRVTFEKEGNEDLQEQFLRNLQDKGVKFESDEQGFLIDPETKVQDFGDGVKEAKGVKKEEASDRQELLKEAKRRGLI